MLDTTINQSLKDNDTVSGDRAGVVEGNYRASCLGCIAREVGACAGFVGERLSSRQSAAGEVPSVGQYYPARRPIVHQREVPDYVPIICSGWAASALVTHGGKRQIVSFSLSGDMSSAAYVFESCSGRSVEAISEVYCRKFKRKDFQAAVQNHAAGNPALSKLIAKEREASDQLHVDLSRRSAETRIARLILSIAARLRSKNVGAGEDFEFPLRQQHIADATGLTTVHVCKILSRMRAAGLIRTGGRHMTILDRAALQEIADQ